MKKLLPLLLFLCCSVVYGRQLYTVKDGNWAADSVWANNARPDYVDDADTIVIGHHLFFEHRLNINGDWLIRTLPDGGLCGDDTLFFLPGSQFTNEGFLGAYFVFLRGVIENTGFMDVGEEGAQIEAPGALHNYGGMVKVHYGHEMCYAPCFANDTAINILYDSATGIFDFQLAGQDGVSCYFDFGDSHHTSNYQQANTYHAYNFPANYTVTIVFSGNCYTNTLTFTLNVPNPPGYTPPCAKVSPFKIYPNPSDGIIYVENEFCQDEPVLISVYDLSGNLLTSSVYYSVEEYIKQKVDLSYLTAGCYLVDVKSATIHTKQQICFLH